tara:strand:- start:107 stop:616 length:510 start_codon:yes stop_codon:yes gene_type:complete
MGLFGDLFGGKAKAERLEQEKRDYIDKLEPLKQYIGNFQKFKDELMSHDMGIVKSNVDEQFRVLTALDNICTKYDNQELVDKMVDEGYFLGMTEEQFYDVVKYKMARGEERRYVNDKNESTHGFTKRKEELLKTKTKVTISNFTKNKKRNKARDYIFENDELVKIVQHG